MYPHQHIVSPQLRVDEWEIPLENVFRHKEIGEGFFGAVYQGIVKGPLSQPRALRNSISLTVAIKNPQR